MLLLSLHTGPIFESIRKARRNTVGQSIILLDRVLETISIEGCCVNVQGNRCKAPRMTKRYLSLKSIESMWYIARAVHECVDSHGHYDEHVG